MAGLLSGLADLGLDHLENMNLYEKSPASKKEKAIETASVKIEEKDLIYDKSFECPVCGETFSSKVVKTGKAKLIGTDFDLRPKYQGIDPVKYDVILCTSCGYAALTRYYNGVMNSQAKAIKEKISKSVKLKKFDGEIYSYDEALERYKLCLVNAIVKQAKASEKAYVCLKSAWLMRGYAEQLETMGPMAKGRMAAAKKEEEDYLRNAYEGFLEAVRTENYPMCGMDQTTMDFLMAQLAFHFKNYDDAGRLVSDILASPAANNRIKDKARELKNQILAGRARE